MYSATSSPSIGSEFEVDYESKWTDSDGRPAPTFKKELYSLTAADASSRYIFIKLCPNRVGVIDHLESLHLFVATTGRNLQVIRTNNEFLTSSALHWTRQYHIIFEVSIPFEHDTVRVVERTHRTLQEMTVKCLAFKSHLSSAYLDVAYEHCALLNNITSGRGHSSSFLLWQPIRLRKDSHVPIWIHYCCTSPTRDLNCFRWTFPRGCFCWYCS